MAQFTVSNICFICGKKFNDNDTVYVLKRGKLVSYASRNQESFYRGIDVDGTKIDENEYRVNWVNTKDSRAFHMGCIDSVVNEATRLHDITRNMDEFIKTTNAAIEEHHKNNPDDIIRIIPMER